MLREYHGQKGKYCGHVGRQNGGYHIASCTACESLVFMTLAERDRGDILGYLDNIIPCCPTPHYLFHTVFVLGEVVSTIFPTCKQTLPEK